MLKVAHARAVGVALFSWWIGFLWLWPRAVRAESLEREARLYDWTSLGYAAGLGLLGGFLAIIYALASDRRVVLTVLADAGRNALVSPIAGMAAYLTLKAAVSFGWMHLTTEPRFLIIVGSGWAGIACFQWVRGFGAAAAPKVRDGLVDVIVSWLKRWQAGAGAGPSTPPGSQEKP